MNSRTCGVSSIAPLGVSPLDRALDLEPAQRVETAKRQPFILLNGETSGAVTLVGGDMGVMVKLDHFFAETRAARRDEASLPHMN